MDSSAESSEEKEDQLPRVTYVKKGSSFQLGVNFSPVYGGVEVESDLRRFSDEWTSYCISMFSFVPMYVGMGYHVAQGHVENEVVDYLQKNSIAQEERENENGDMESVFVVHNDDVAIISQKMNSTHQSAMAAHAMERSSLSALLSEYEFLIERVIERVVKTRMSDFTNDLTYLKPSDLRAANSIEALLETIALKRIRSELRNKSHMEVLEWISENLKITAIPDPELKKQFVEICQRRHLLMHAGGRVNERYVDNCLKAGWSIDELDPIGTTLRVKASYLRRATARVYQVGLFVLHMLWQSIGEDAAQNSYGNLLSTSHDFLLNDLTKMARRVCNFAKFSEKKFPHRLKMCFQVNLALCELFDDSIDEVEQTKRSTKVVEEFDWSVTTPEFDLILACLKREQDQIMPLAGKAVGVVNYFEANTYAVYREARKIDGFLKLFPKTSLRLPAPDAV